MESEGLEEKYRAVINGGYPDGELVGRRWGEVEPALWRFEENDVTARKFNCYDGTGD